MRLSAPPEASPRRGPRALRLKDILFGGTAVVLAALWVVAAARIWPALAPAARASATPRPTGAVDAPLLPGRLAVALGGDVYLIRDGRMLPLTSGGNRRDPALSPDGQRVAYAIAATIEGKRIVDGQTVPAHLAYESVAIRATSGGAPEEIVVNGLQRRDPGGFHAVEFEIEPAWSPDGTQLAFISDDGNGAELQVLTLASGRIATLSRGSVLADPAWSPDGAVIAVTTYTLGTPGILLVPADGRAQARRLTLARAREAYRPAYSPDGGWLLVTLRTERGNDLVAAELRSERVVEATSDGRSWGGVFSPDGERIAFLREHDGLIDLFVMELGELLRGGAAKPVQQITRGGGVDGASRPSWSR